MKKKNEEKQQRILKIIKIIGCSLGLLLCGGAFIGLLFVGIRGCVSQNNRKVDNQSTLSTLNNRKAVDYGVEYENYVYLSQYYYDNGVSLPVISNNVSPVYDIEGYINNIHFDFIRSHRGQSNNVWYNGLSFYTGDWSTTSSSTMVASIDYHIIGGGLDMLVTETQNIKVGDVFRFVKSEDLETLKNNNNSNFYYLVDSGVIVPAVNYSITFNNQINRYGPLAQDNSVFALGSYTGTKVFLHGLFKDAQGLLYNEISITYVVGGASQYTTDGQNVYIQPNEPSSSMFISLNYRRILQMDSEDVSTTLILVNSANYTTVGDKYPVYTNSSSWLSAYFQNINIIYIDDNYDYSVLPTGNYTRLDVLSSLNQTGSYNEGIITGGGSFGGVDVFTLIGNAFSSLIPLLNTQVLPGVTIGVLLFIPLVASIVLFVVWLFKR